MPPKVNDTQLEEVLDNYYSLHDQLKTLKRNFDKTSIARRTRGYVQKRVELVDETFKQIRECDAIIRRSAGFAESNYNTENQFDEIDEFYANFSGDLADCIRALDQPAVDHIPPNNQIQENPVQQQNQQNPNFRLPQITLPTFSGDYATWSAFSDMFKSLIHNNAALTNVQKLHYLKCNLRDDAANLLRNTATTNDNYAIAWNMLETRFANKRALVDAQLKVLLLQSNHQEESASNIRNLIDRTKESLNALGGLQVNVQSWDPILLFMLVQKLSRETHKAWETDQQGKQELPTLDDFTTFLENRFRMLETIANHETITSPSHNQSTSSRSSRQVKSHVIQRSSPLSTSCPICKESHSIRSCSKFLQMSILERRNAAKQHRICFNCLVQGHLVPDCRNRSRCQKCNKSHHTLLHQNTQSAVVDTTQPITSSHLPSSSGQAQAISSESCPPLNRTTYASHTSNLTSFDAPKVLLATAIIKASSHNGEEFHLRALIDQGSEVTLLTTNAAQLLKLKPMHVNLPLSGIGQSSAGRLRHLVQLVIRSDHQSDFVLRTNAFVINTITGMTPRTPCTVRDWPHIRNKPLADPSFATPGKIDVLLGSDTFKRIILPGVIHGESDAPVAQYTAFGWILSGDIEFKARVQIQPNMIALHTCIDIDQRLKTFWEVENTTTTQTHYTTEESMCEEHYRSTISRSPDGRYIVRLPLRSHAQLGESRNSALQRLLQIERSLSKNTARQYSYVEFMREYISLGHMKVSDSSTSSNANFIPHHAVFKESSSTTKTRVVFDASNKSTNGNSLNDILLTGPKIQDDLSTILLRWRKFPIAFTADVEKMYRQILVHRDDQELQHILWRESPNDPIVAYALQTVTYGTSCAPFLAVRTLQQLAIDYETILPEAANIVRKDFYVDDLMSGAFSESKALLICRQLNELMNKAGLHLRKWSSNNPTILKVIHNDDREDQHMFNIEINNTITALGIVWNPTNDTFNFNFNLSPTERMPTKRNVLSDISKLFDPLGWMAPAIVRSKIMMQKLWVKGVSWDELLPECIIAEWKSIREDLVNIKTIRINRWINHHDGPIELHGFCDASTDAYAAAIYARIKQPDGQYICTLLTAKTRVAPLKQLSIPRLELCGAVLVSELLVKAQADLNVTEYSMYAWTDSTIVLHWIHTEPRKFKTFVANRISSIQQTIHSSKWRHVPTSDNPADCASRGLDVNALREHSLWWQGPTWLKESHDKWPNSKFTSAVKTTSDDEHRIVCNIAVSTQQQLTEDMLLLNSVSSIVPLLRIVACCYKFIDKCKKATLNNHTGVSVIQLQKSLRFWIKVSQRNAFQEDIENLQKHRPLSSNSKLSSLNPFLDEHLILRVGGRLQKSNLSFNEKHPIVLCNKCNLSTLIIRQKHLETMHGGPQLVLGLVRKQYWILNARNAIRLIIHRCVTCHRYKATSASQLMGNLPEPRINITRAFTHTGVDYAGPIDLRMSKGRGNTSYKGYISIFICLCTKAIHIEVVSDLTSNAFIAAYRRFVARRGLPAHMYSDNATNFVGTVKALRKKDASVMMKVRSEIINNINQDSTEWHFIPPSSPHFGGLWEAGVKSLKFHMKRSIGNAKLTYEELTTLTTQIEACLNSRPLSPITNDIEDLTALTPGHFLIGDALLAPPGQGCIDPNVSLLSRWHQIQRHYETIASRWKSEYLSRLQQRPKWVKQTKNIEVGDLVLIKDSNISPSNWPLARVIATHPGTDNLVRVVTVRTGNSTFKRAITKISPLPI